MITVYEQTSFKPAGATGQRIAMADLHNYVHADNHVVHTGTVRIRVADRCSRDGDDSFAKGVENRHATGNSNLGIHALSSGYSRVQQ